MKKSFIIKNTPILYYSSLLMSCISFSMILFYYLFEDNPNIIIPIFCFSVLLLPFGIGAIWAKRYYVKVDDTLITVQKAFRLKPIQFHISEIQKIIIKLSNTNYGENTKIEIYTPYGKFSVETLMIGFNNMKLFLERNVCSDKIEIYRMNFNK